MSLKWAELNRTSPSITMGVPSNEHINSPVISGDQIIEAGNEECIILKMFSNDKLIGKNDEITKHVKLIEVNV